jgi:methyl-accepting chemotaxis protein
VHEITATVRQNADNAQAASQLATAARDTAEKGGAVVADAVTAVTQIEESAQKISDIVGLIDEIAFQTNLLALNASVEAARAGEAGKGFAVVAQEVRALAQRSANASKDIKALISASNAQVKTGATLVNQTGSSLTEIVNAVKKVTDIVAEIAAASREQATGLDQINTAVASMDETTQRNGALVEQTSASAQALANQGREIAALVGFFKTGATATATTPVVRTAAATAPAPKPAEATPNVTPAPKPVAATPTVRAAPPKAAPPKAAPLKTAPVAKPAPAVAEDDDWQEF